MASKYTDIVRAVLEGNTVLVPPEYDISPNGLRVAIWRELKTLKKQESELGIETSLQRKQISIKDSPDGLVAKLIMPEKTSVPFKIITTQEGE